MTIAFVLASSAHGPMLVNRMDYNHISTGDFYGVGAQIMENGCYDPREVELLRQLFALRRGYYGDGCVALDCGANIGVVTVELAKSCKGWGNVIAVEAQERIFYALAGNLALQNCFNARAIWAALDDNCGTIGIPEPDYTQAGSFGSFELKPSIGTEFIGQPIDYSKPTSIVRTITVDSLKLERLDLLKMDVEGMEVEALAGAKETIERCKPILFVETVKADKAKVIGFLKSLGYQIFPHGMNTMAVHLTDPCAKKISVEEAAA